MCLACRHVAFLPFVSCHALHLMVGSVGKFCCGTRGCNVAQRAEACYSTRVQHAGKGGWQTGACGHFGSNAGPAYSPSVKSHPPTPLVCLVQQTIRGRCLPRGGTERPPQVPTEYRAKPGFPHDEVEPRTSRLDEAHDEPRSRRGVD